MSYSHIQTILNTRTSEAGTLQQEMKLLDFLNPEAAKHTEEIANHFELPVEVAILAFRLVRFQVRNGITANPNRLFQSLNKNDRKDYSTVVGKYNEAIKKYAELNSSISEQDVFNFLATEDKPIMTTKSTTQKEGLMTTEAILKEQPTSTKPASDFDVNEYTMFNIAKLPKQSWVMKVLCFSYEEYVDIVRSTAEDIVHKGFATMILQEEKVKEKIEKFGYCEAIHILINDKFSILSLSETTIQKFETTSELAQKIRPSAGIKIEDITYVDIQRYTADIYLCKNGDTSAISPITKYAGTQPSALLDMFENIGNNTNPIKAAIEIEAGLFDEMQQSYKAIVISETDRGIVEDIIADYDTNHLDFTIKTNQENAFILFVHHSHLKEVVSEFIEYEVYCVINPAIDEWKYNPPSSKNEGL